jgi:hypothetical protein
MERVARYAPGAILVGALAIAATGAGIGFLAPSLRDAPPFVSDDVRAVADAIAGNPTAWQWANAMFLIAMLLAAFALVPIGLRLRTGSWAVLGIVAFAIAAVFEVLGRMLAIEVFTWAAQRYDDPGVVTVYEAFDGFDGALGYVAWLLAFVAVVFFGFALRSAGDTAGWMFVAIGAIGIVVAAIGLAIPLYVFLATAALGVASWRLSPS